jgi:hypothetical protein
MTLTLALSSTGVDKQYLASSSGHGRAAGASHGKEHHQSRRFNVTATRRGPVGWDEDDDARAAVNKSAETWDDERMERLPLPGQVGYERQS